MYSLLIDFGASRVKVALCDGKDIVKAKDYLPVPPVVYDRLRYEISPLLLKELFENIVDSYLDYGIKSILICSEQHGFALSDGDKFVTNYISWKDNRAFEEIDGISSIDFVKKYLPDFRNVTGMNIKCGIPAINIIHLLRTFRLPKKIKVCSLPDILTGSRIHSTMLAGLGIWDIYKKEIYKDLEKLYMDFGYEVTFNYPTYEIEVSGIFKGISVYTAVGDNQCALFGAKLAEGDIIINMGTGSQIAKIDEPDPLYEMEQRPYLNNKTLSIITHIPSGRALNCFVGFIEELFSLANSDKSAWDIFQNITLEDIKKSTLLFDLGVFESAYGFKRGGAISNIIDRDFNINNYLSSLLKAYMNQYINIINRYNIKYSKIILAGGISKKLNIIMDYIHNMTKKEVLKNNIAVDETLEGLRILSTLI